MKLIIIGGLPASGKSTLAESYPSIKSRTYNLDSVKKKSKDDINSYVRSISTGYLGRTYDNIIVEGLLTTTDDVIKLLKRIDLQKYQSIDIIWFKENREQCIVNDLWRLREENCTRTILNLPYEPIDLDRVKAEIKRKKVNLITKEVYVMEDWKKFANKYNIYLSEQPSYYNISSGNKMYLVGDDSWEISGSWNSCWGHVRDVEEESPTEFTELNSLLEKVCPSISFLQYKKLDPCLDTAEIDIGDYYSNVTGGVNICNIKDLYTILVEEGLYDPEKLTLENEQT